MKLRYITKIAVTGIFAAAAFAGFAVKGSTQTQTKVVTAGQKFKNIKVLNDVPADQVGKIMNIMSASLGFDCAGCHVSGEKDFEKDDNHHKQTAREMIAMTMSINKQFFDGRPEVSCNTCHNGHERPQSLPSLMPPTQHSEAPSRPVQPTVKPTIDQIIDRYTAALGGKEKIASVKSRSITAKRIEPDGKTSEPEMIEQMPGKIRIETAYGEYKIVQLFDGEKASMTANGAPADVPADQLEQIKREAQLFADPDLKSVYTKIEYRFTDKIDGRDVYLVIATLADNSRERLYFDTQTGLLVRRSVAMPTVIGQFQYQVDYSDYKDFGGVKLPATIRYAMPDLSWTRVISEVKINTNIDPARSLQKAK